MLSHIRLVRDRLTDVVEDGKDVMEVFPLDELKYLCDICELLAELGVCDLLHSGDDEDA